MAHLLKRRRPYRREKVRRVIPEPELDAVLALAARCPSPFNSQPWRIEARGDVLSVFVDRGRHLPFSDGSVRGLNVTLGAFTEALRRAALSVGRKLSLREPPPGAFSSLAFTGATTVDPLHGSLLRQRQTSRLGFSPRAPAVGEVQALRKVAQEGGLSLHLLSASSPERRDVEALLFAAEREELLDPRVAAESWSLLHLDPRKVPERGLNVLAATGSDREAALLPLLSPLPLRALQAAFAGPLVAEKIAKLRKARFSAAPLLGVLVAEGELAGAGAGVLNLWLEATKQRLQLEPSSALLSRRGWPLAKRLGTEPSRLVFAFRLGRSAPPPATGRLPVAAFANRAA